MHSSLGYLPPMEFEQLHHADTAMLPLRYRSNAPHAVGGAGNAVNGSHLRPRIRKRQRPSQRLQSTGEHSIAESR